MGFNKRYFSIRNILSYASSASFESFKVYMLNPDACFFSDEEAHRIWNEFVDAENDEARMKIYQSLKNS